MTTALDTETLYNESGVLVMDGEPGQQDFYGEILLDRTAYPLAGPIGEQNLAVFQGKSVIGDYTLDSNPLLSAWVISDGSGGHGVEHMNVVSDPARYHIGTLFPRHPKQISTGFRVHTLDPDIEGWTGAFAGGDIRFVGDMKDSSLGTFTGYVTMNATLYNITAASLGTLTAEPTGKAVVYKGLDTIEKLVIPMGASGYATLDNDGSTFVNQAAAAGTYPAAQSLLVWDNKLIALDTDGRLWHTEDLGGTWTDYGTTAQLPNASTGRQLVSFFDRNIGAPAVFLITDTDIWQSDLAMPSVYTVNAKWPPHPDHGNAACMHDGDLFVSVGMGVHRYTNGSFLAMGLDQRDGLPMEYQGAIVDLVSESYSGMFALVGKGNDWQALDWRDGEEEKDFRSSLHLFTGSGWHMLWEGVGEVAIPNSMFVSRHDSNYRLYWGIKTTTGCALKYIDLPRTWATPSQRSRMNGGFASSGYMEFSRFDAGMEGYRKLASHLQIKVKGLTDGGRATVLYRTDDSTRYRILGAVGKDGTFSLPFGTDASGVFAGEIWEDIQFYLDVEGVGYNGILIPKMVFAYVKLVEPSDAWKVQLDLTKPYRDLSPEEMHVRLRSLVGSGFVPLTIGGVTKRVLVSQISRTRQPGQDTRSIVPVSILQIPEVF